MIEQGSEQTEAKWPPSDFGQPFPTSYLAPGDGSAAGVPNRRPRYRMGLFEGRAELRLLHLCLRSDARERAGELEELLERPLDWRYLLRSAGHHEVLPLLYWNLAMHYPRELPESVTETLRQHFQAADLRNRMVFESCRECCRALRRAGVPVAVFKGAALALQVYEHPALRQFGDLDLLIPPRHLDTAAELLGSLDYRPVYPVNMLRDPRRQRLDERQQTLYRRAYHEITFESADGLVQVDLHWRFSPRVYGMESDQASVWGEVRDVPNEEPLAGLSPELQLVNLCVHAAKDRWTRLKWLVDLDRLLRAGAGVDWRRVHELTRRNGAERMLAAGARAAQQLFDSPVAPAFVRRASTPDLKLLDRCLAFPPRQPPREVKCLGVNRVYLRLCGGWDKKMAYLVRALCLPQPKDPVLFGVGAAAYARCWPLLRPLFLLRPCLTRLFRHRSMDAR